MTGIVLTQAALHAALRRVRDDGTYASLDMLLTLLDPAHAAPAEMAAGGRRRAESWAALPSSVPAQAGTPAPPTIELPAEPGTGALTPGGTSAAAGERKPPEAPPPAQAAEGHPTTKAARTGRPGSTWTADRVALLRADYPTCTDRPALLARINALPGDQVPTVKAMMQRAAELRIRATMAAVRAIETEAGTRGGAASLARQPSTPSTMRTAERMAALPALWKDPNLSARMVMEALNKLPGDRINNSQVLYKWAGMAGLPRQRPLLSESLRPAPADASRARTPSPRLAGATALPGAAANGGPSQRPETPAMTDRPGAVLPLAPQARPQRVEAPPPAAPSEPTPEQQAAIADAAVASKQDRAKTQLRALLAEKPRDMSMRCAGIAGTMGLPLREVMRLLGEVRNEGAIA